MKAILGRKAGMTQVFTTDGVMVPVTVIEVLPNVVLQKKTVENDGYEALQVGYEEQRANITNKPSKGIFDKANEAIEKKTGLNPQEIIDVITIYFINCVNINC